MKLNKKFTLFALAILPIPFTSQAPLAKWSDVRQEDGCEEASAVMAMAWTNGEKAISKITAEKEIVAISDFELKKYGQFHDVALKDLRQWVFLDYFKYNAKKVRVVENIKLADIKKELSAGHLVLVPTNGQALKNPYYKSPGPERHMLVIKGYDAAKKEFIVNDSGTKRGESYRYGENILFSAIRAYPTGDHLPIVGTKKVMLAVER